MLAAVGRGRRARSRRRRASPRLAFDTDADLLQHADRHLRRRSGRRRRQLEGRRSSSTRGPAIRTPRSATTARSSAAARGCSSSIADGKFVRELGQDVYGFNAAIGLRVDPQDNVWTIDDGANQVVKFDPDGRVALVLGRKPETMCACGAPRRRRPGGRRGAGARARAGAGTGSAGAGAAANRRPGAGTPGLELQPPDRRRLGRGRQHLRRRRYRHQQPHREVRQGRPLHHALGLDRHRARASSTA